MLGSEEEEEAACSPCLRDRQGAPPLLLHMKPERNSNTCFPRCSYLHTREGPAETPPDVLVSSRLARHPISMSSFSRATPRACSPCPALPGTPARHGSTSPPRHTRPFVPRRN